MTETPGRLAPPLTQLARPVGVAVAWSDIASAPRDGTIIDLWHEELGRQADCYWGKPQHSCGEAGQYCDSDWHREPEGWVHSSFNSVLYDADSFTHWMPSPAGPDATRPVDEPGEVERLTRERDEAQRREARWVDRHDDQATKVIDLEAALAETRGLVRDAIGLVPLAHQNWHTDARAALSTQESSAARLSLSDSREERTRADVPESRS